MKKYLSCLFFTLIPMLVVASVNIGSLYYDLNEQTMTAEVVRHPNYNYTGKIVIPSTITYNNKPYTVTSINNNAFGYSSNMTSLTIPETITNISGLAFRDNKGLVELKVKEGNPKYDSRDGCNAIIESASNCLIVGCKNTIIPSTISAIDNYCFYGCTTLTSITIPEGVVSIGRQAFFDCQKLKSIHIPSSVVNIREEAFWHCSILSSISVDTNNPQYDSRKNCNAIIETKSNTLVVGGSNTAIPDDVITIGEYAFAGNENLKTIIIPNSVQNIEEHAFYGCHNLTSIILPDGMTTIKESTFAECTGLSEAVIPNSITSIEKAAFSYCRNLQNLYCFAEKVPTTHADAFKDIIQNITLHVPFDTYSMYKNAAPWNSFKNIVIEKRKLIVTIVNSTREYGEDNPQFNIRYSGFVGEDDENVINIKPSVSTTASKTSDVGIYPITISGGSSENYDLIYEQGVLTILKAPLIAKINDVSKQYGKDNPTLVSIKFR